MSHGLYIPEWRFHRFTAVTFGVKVKKINCPSDNITMMVKPKCYSTLEKTSENEAVFRNSPLITNLSEDSGINVDSLFPLN